MISLNQTYDCSTSESDNENENKLTFNHRRLNVEFEDDNNDQAINFEFIVAQHILLDLILGSETISFKDIANLSLVNKRIRSDVKRTLQIGGPDGRYPMWVTASPNCSCQSPHTSSVVRFQTVEAFSGLQNSVIQYSGRLF
jgi:hypothetical protein